MQKNIIDHEALILLLIEAHVCNRSEISGCSQQEILSLEKSIGLSLPAQYKEFLLSVGKGAGSYFRGTNIFFPGVSLLKNEAINLLKENEEDFAFIDGDFVFSMHQGYEFCYFNASEGDNPPVFQYVEGNGPPILIWKSLSDFLRDSIASHSSTSHNHP